MPGLPRLWQDDRLCLQQNIGQLPNDAMLPLQGRRRNLGADGAVLRMGEAIRTDRIRENCGGRERARMLGLTPLQLNDVEHGKVDPMEVL